MQIYSKKKVEELVVQNLAQQGGEKEEKVILKQLYKVYNHYNKKHPIYLVMIEAPSQWVAAGYGTELAKMFRRCNIQAIVVPCAGRREYSVEIAEVKE